ncbi:peptide transporter ptr2, partial [Coemansia erecta]
NGTEVVVDRELTVQSIFNWFYWAINVGGLSAIATTELESNVDFWAAYLLPTLMCFFCLIAFVLGKKKYVIVNPNGSILIKCYHVIVAGIRNHRKAKKENSIVMGEDGKPVGWMDYAKPSVSHDDSLDWTDKFVDELRTAVRSCKIFCAYPFFWLGYNQISNNLISQAGQMNTGNVPNDIMQNIDPLCIIIMIPIFDRLIFPGFRRMGLELRPVTRMTIGFIFSALAMAYSAIIQHVIYTTGPYYDAAGDGDNGFNNINAGIQVPAYILVALSEIFASVTGLEYAYKRAPESMKSIVMSIFLFTNAGGSILGFCFNSISANPHLVKNFAIISGLMGGVTVLFFFLFRHYDRREADELKSNMVYGKEGGKIDYSSEEA